MRDCASVGCLARCRNCVVASREEGSVGVSRLFNGAQIGHVDETYLCGFLAGASLPLREGGCRRLFPFGRLSLRKEDHQRILFTRLECSSFDSRETMAPLRAYGSSLSITSGHTRPSAKPISGCCQIKACECIQLPGISPAPLREG